MRTTQTIALTSGLAFGSLIAYAFYFDYKRRNDPDFRRKIRQQRRKADKLSASLIPKPFDPTKVSDAELDAVLEELEEEAKIVGQIPMSERQGLFLHKVQQADDLLQGGPPAFLTAAACYFQAARFYPDPDQLFDILKKTQPPAMVDLIDRLRVRDIAKLNVGRRGGRRSPPRGDAILEEIPASDRPRTSSRSGSPTSSGPKPGFLLSPSSPPTTKTSPSAASEVPAETLAPTAVGETTPTLVSGAESDEVRTIPIPLDSSTTTTIADNSSAHSSPVAVSHASFDPTTPPVLVSVPTSEAGDLSEPVEGLSLSGSGVVVSSEDAQDKVEVEGSTAGTGVGVVELGSVGKTGEDEEEKLEEVIKDEAEKIGELVKEQVGEVGASGPGSGVGA